jgi:hypothetical protein
MSRLRRRIVGQAGNARAAASDYHPYGTADTPMVMPMVHVQFNSGGALVQQMAGIVTPNGAVIPAVPAAPFGHVPIAGGGRY